MNLSYKEMTLWLHIVIVSLVYGVYFTFFIRSILTGAPLDGRWIGFLVVTTIVIVFSETVSQGILALFKRKEANQPPDERDQYIESTATRIAYYVLVTGLWFGFSTIFFLASPLFIFNIIFFFFVIGELSSFIYQLIIYRRAA
jgi:hypothetical protein